MGISCNEITNDLEKKEVTTPIRRKIIILRTWRQLITLQMRLKRGEEASNHTL